MIGKAIRYVLRNKIINFCRIYNLKFIDINVLAKYQMALNTITNAIISTVCRSVD